MKFNKNILSFFAKIDIVLILGFFFFPTLSFISPLFSLFDELLIIVFLIIISLKSFVIKIDSNFFKFTLITFLIYAVFLIFKNNLPKTHIFQFLITIKFLIVFIYFTYKNNRYKDSAYLFFIKVITILYIISVLIGVIQFTIPGVFELSKDGRGLNGITLIGFCLSRTLYSQFLVLCIILIYTLKPIKDEILINLICSNKKKLIFFTFILLFLTFTRKDLLFGIFILFFLMYKTVKGKNKIFLYLSTLFVIILIPIISSLFFKKINDETFNEDQVRLLILFSGLKVYENYKPFGAGPGTFGSTMSIKYDKVYKKFNIPERVYKGVKGQERGPIFDVFIISLLAEYGIGAVFFVIFYFLIYFTKEKLKQDEYINIKLFKSSVLIFVFLSSFTVPILNNIVGYLIFTFLGLCSNAIIYNNKNEKLLI